MNALVVSSGSINNYKVLKELATSHDFIICADGGIRHLMEIKINPDIIIGDLDSIDDISRNYISQNNLEIIKYPIQKDETDTELAIIYLMEHGYKDITLTGVTGTRMDHTLSNIFLLRNLDKNNIQAKIIDDNNTIYYTKNYMKLKKVEPYYVSIIPISLEGVIVTLNGFLYPLMDHKIEFGSSLGVSNKIIEDEAEVFIISGEALIIVSKD